LTRPVTGQTATITVQQASKAPQVLTVNLISRAQYRRAVPPGPQRSSLGSEAFYHDGRTCYWQYNQCNASAQGQEYIEAMFRSVREHPVANLIIDLRYNPGGSDNAVQLIIDHLTEKPYRLYSCIGGRISDHLLRANPGWYLRPLKGMRLTFAKGAKKPKAVANRFKGSVYVLISPRTFSAASDLANVLQDYGLATFIGEETGGLRQCFGEAADDRLPNSGLGFRVSCKVFYAPRPKPDDARRGTVPDIAISDELLSPFMHDADPELAFTLDWIQERQPQ
jgi:C-terminal processing protease CtpA/Prc